jgi:hypothetical protein
MLTDSESPRSTLPHGKHVERCIAHCNVGEACRRGPRGT